MSKDISPRDIRELIVYERRHDVGVLFEYCRGVDLKNRLGVQAGQVFNGVEIKRVHTMLKFSANV